MRSWTIVLGAMATVGLMMTALWGWQNASVLVSEWSRPDIATYAVRCAAVALAAAAQLVVLLCVVGRAFSPGRADTVAGVLAAAVCGVSGVSAVALTLVGR
ncbi:MAG TPA: hypothetical protein VGN72_01510 [Tepidisphaeraceae bacterium]|nr:hypothetical protein [Tepidisphaeraceae bacterium]